MKKLNQIFFFLCLLLGVCTLTYAQVELSETRGQLLYSTHCSACHTSQVHWREQKLVRDWRSLVAQVRRWQSISGLNWSEDEIVDVAHHLNTVYYGFKNTAQGKKPSQLMIQD
jgi:mono/diheme cytochrome c family protein